MSDLLKMNLAIENDMLKRRVSAAVVQTAQQQVNAGGAGGVFAGMILADVRVEWDDFILGVAADQGVQDKIAVSDDNNFIVASNVTDDQIIAIVNGHWGAVADKYAATQTPAEDTEAGE